MKTQEKDPWQKTLTPEQYDICWNKATEAPFSGQYNACKTEGIYYCNCCSNPLFDSESKYDSGSGWPSFWDTLTSISTEEIPDHSQGMQRIEIRCQACHAHLGHLFQDGPQPTGLRYCINSASLNLKTTP